MDINSKEFQALHNLTGAFIEYLETVSPMGAPQELKIQFIAQSLQKLNGLFQSIEADRPQPTGKETIMDASSKMAEMTTAAHQEPNVAPVSKLPQEANLFCVVPTKLQQGDWIFERPKPVDGDSRLFKLYVNEKIGIGEFEMKPINDSNYQVVYESRERILPPEVVVTEGSIESQCESQCIERGELNLVDFDGSKRWKITKPCKIKITPTA